ncbi:MAG: LysR substrate-binding domain-containing protein [Planctomycetes bacterium]|nr:LysR substrate-binding domain-containing protein [Planctomycetota bacterium]
MAQRVLRNEVDLGFVGARPPRGAALAGGRQARAHDRGRRSGGGEGAVAAGIGYFYMSIHGLAGGIARGQLVRLPVTGPRLRRNLFLVRHRDKRLSPAASAFAGFVRDHLPKAL